MQRTLFKASPPTTSTRSDTPNSHPDYSLDALIIGAGFAGFNAKIVEGQAGTDFGGVWHFNY